MKPSKNAVISRHFACFVFQPYVFFLLFLPLRAETREIYSSEYKTAFSAGNQIPAFESEIHPLHKSSLSAMVFHSYTWRTARKRERPKQAQTVAGARQTAKATKEIPFLLHTFLQLFNHYFFN